MSINFGFNGSILSFYVVPLFCHVFVAMTQLFRYFLLLVWAIYFKCVWRERRGQKSGLNKQECGTRENREPSGGIFCLLHHQRHQFFFVIYEVEYMEKGVKIEEKA